MEAMISGTVFFRIVFVSLCFNIIAGSLAHESDLDTLHFSNIVSMAFVSSDHQALEAVTIIQKTLHINARQSYLTNSHTNLLTAFHEFARNVDHEQVALFAVQDLHSVDRFLDEMHFLHSVTDSHAPYARIVVLLLWNMTQSHILDADRPDVSMYHQFEDEFPSLYVEKWKVAVISRWHVRGNEDINGDALIGRISRMAVLPMSHHASTDSTTLSLSQAFEYSPHVHPTPSQDSWTKLLLAFVTKEIPAEFSSKITRISRIIYSEFNFRKLIAELDVVLPVLCMLIFAFIMAIAIIILCVLSRPKRNLKKRDELPTPVEKRVSQDYTSAAIAPPIYGYHTTSSSMIHRNVSSNSVRSGSISGPSSYRY